MIQNYFPDDDEETLIDIPINAQEFEEYVNCDKDTECFGPLTEEEIVSCILEDTAGEVSPSEDTMENTIEVNPPSFAEVLTALETVKKYMEGNNLEFDELEILEEKLFKKKFQNMRQKKMTDFFAI